MDSADEEEMEADGPRIAFPIDEYDGTGCEHPNDHFVRDVMESGNK